MFSTFIFPPLGLCSLGHPLHSPHPSYATGLIAAPCVGEREVLQDTSATHKRGKRCWRKHGNLRIMAASNRPRRQSCGLTSSRQHISV